jgi:hypothetical protein
MVTANFLTTSFVRTVGKDFVFLARTAFPFKSNSYFNTSLYKNRMSLIVKQYITPYPVNIDVSV